MGNTPGKFENYQQQYEKMNDAGIDFELLDRYKVLNVQKNFTWAELKDAYKAVAKKTHPDKKGGNKVVFDFVTKCFQELADEYKLRKEDRPHQELKKESNEYFEKMINSSIPHPSVATNEPFERRFNKVFDECKYKDEDTDYGYGNIMTKSNSVREDISIENVFNKDKVDSTTFNEEFNKKVPVSKSVVKYKEPEALCMSKSLQFTEIGSGRPDDYSSGVEITSLRYTDYMKAYDGNRLADPDDIKAVKSFKSVKEYEVYRDKKVKKTLSDREKKLIEKQKEQEEKQEWERQERIKMQNIDIQRAHERANRLLIK